MEQHSNRKGLGSQQKLQQLRAAKTRLRKAITRLAEAGFAGVGHVGYANYHEREVEANEWVKNASYEAHEALNNLNRVLSSPPEPAVTRQRAHLIAAVSDLLEAARLGLLYVETVYREHGRDYLPNSGDALEKIQGAIAKAEGVA